MTKTETTTQDFATEVLDDLVAKVIDAIETNPGNWTKPWADTILTSGMPTNVKGYAYTGGNVLLGLFAQMVGDFQTNIWGTKAQWTEALGVAKTAKIIKKGSHKTYFLRPNIVTITTDKAGKPLPKSDHKRMVVGFKAFGAFNADQIEGGTEWAADRFGTTDRVVDPIEHAERFVANTKAIVLTGSAAYYSPPADSITLPPRDAFVDSDAYYSTAVHELGHWTGHRSRLNREGITTPAAQKTRATYAFEELIAELTSVIVGATQLGLTVEPRPDNVAYLDFWVRALKESPKVLWRAASAASKAAGFLADLQPADDLVAA